jgi:hypothetical protein
MQPIAHRFSRSILLVALCAAAPFALAGAAQSTITTKPLPVDQVLGRASGEEYFETRPEVGTPHAVKNALDRVETFVSQPAHPIPPERFGRGGGNLPAGG